MKKALIGDLSMQQRNNWNDDDLKRRHIKVFAVTPLLLYLAAIFLISLFSVFVGRGDFADLVIHNFVLLLGLPAAVALAVALVIKLLDNEPTGRFEFLLFEWFKYAGQATKVMTCVAVILTLAAVLSLFR